MNCLVIVDMQEGFMNDYTWYLKKRLASFLEERGEFFPYIVATRYINHKNTACYKFEGWEDCMQGSEKVELIPEVKTIPGIKVIDKDVYSAYNKELKNFIKENNITKLYFAGVNTGCCVLHSALDSYNDLVDTYVIEDLCNSTLGEESHECAINVLKECITERRVRNSESLWGN